MAQNTTLTLQPKTWTQLTNSDISAISFQVISSQVPVMIKATVGAVAPTNETGSVAYNRFEGEAGMALATMFSGLTGANRIYAYTETGAASVFVSHA